MKTTLRVIKLFIFYILSSASSIIIWNLNSDFVKTATSADMATKLGTGFSKIILIPLYIILFLVAISLGLSSFITSIKLTKTQSKTIKVISIIMILLTLALLGFVVYISIQTVKLF